MTQDITAIEQATTSSESNTSLNTEKVGVSLLMAISMSFLAALICLVFYHFILAPKPIKLGLLDVQSLSTSLENQARQAIVENINATDAEREAAANVFESKMKTLQGIITQIGNDCQCVLLVKAAALNSRNTSLPMMDYTNVAREQLGIQVASAPAVPTAVAPTTAPAEPQTATSAAPSVQDVK